jgi:beta-glucoside operon transcriptional antiterminator
MKLLRKINNNAAVAQDKRGREMVVLGRGVGFHPMPYELTDLSVVYRTFYDVEPQYYEMLSSLPEEALMAAADIAEQAEIALQAELNPNLPFTLADHIAFAQEREKQGIRLATPLHYDVQHLYPREYELGLQAMETVRLRTGTALPRAEAVNIALHIVNAELEGSDLSSTLAAVEVLDEVTVLVERELGIALDRESYNYARFAMHIQFLVRRLSSGKVMEQGSDKMLSELSAEYPATYRCAQAVAKEIEQRHGWHCSSDEVLYLMLHIYRVQNRQND